MRLVILGLPPTTNNLYAIVSGRQVKVESGRAWTRVAAAVAAAAWGDRPASASAFAVLITYHLGAYERDVDGSHKAIVDGFAPRERGEPQRPIVWHDDRQLVLLAARKVRAPHGVLPYVSIVVRELPIAPRYLEPSVVPGALGFETTIMPPTTNNAYTTFGGTRRKSVASREAYATYQAGFARLVATSTDPGRFPLEGPLRVRVRHGYTADRRDVDGSHKLLLDAARGEGQGTGLVWRDDLQITSLSLAKGRVPSGEAPRIAGDVRPLAPEGSVR